jgi:vitamin B12 transporter
VLIDGVQINDPSSTGGGFDFGNLLVGDIARVEILRGPQSTLYGSQAIGGVINIVTREADDRPSGRLQAEYGSRSTSQYKAGVGARYDGLSFRLGGARYETDGVSAFDAGSETDPFRNTSFAGRVGYAFSPDFSVDLRAYYADGQSNYDGFPPPFFVFADEGDYTNSRQLITLRPRGASPVGAVMIRSPSQAQARASSTTTPRMMLGTKVKPPSSKLA